MTTVPASESHAGFEVPQWAVWVSRVLRAAAVLLFVLAVVTGLTKTYIVGTVPTLLQAAMVCLLGSIVVLLDEIRSEWRQTRR